MDKKELIRLLKIHTQGTGLFPEAIAAQMMHESGMLQTSGLSQLSRDYNNYSGIKAVNLDKNGSGPNGEKVEGVDFVIFDTWEDFPTKEARDEYIAKEKGKRGNTDAVALREEVDAATGKVSYDVKLGQPFAIFENAEEAVKGHIAFLQRYKRYKKVFTAKTPEEQLAEIKAAGYALDTGYTFKNIDILNDTVRVEFPEFQLPETQKAKNKEAAGDILLDIIDRKTGQPMYSVSNMPIEYVPGSDPSSTTEEIKLNKLQQSVADKYYQEVLDAKDLIGLEGIDDEAIKEFIEKEVSKTTDENELLKLSEKDASEFLEDKELAELSKKLKTQYEQELEFINGVLNNKSNYSADVIKQAEDAKDAITRWNARGTMNQAGVSNKQIKKATAALQEKLNAADVPGLITKIGEEDRERLPQITDEDVAKDLETELIEGLQKAPLPEGAEDAQIEFTDDELINIEEEEEEGEFIDTSAYLKKLEKQQRKQDRKDKLNKLAEGIGSLGPSIKAAGVALMAGAGLKSMHEATKKHEINKIRISPLMEEAFQKAKAMSTQGLTYAERAAAMADLNNAYAGALKNVMAVSGGQRSTALANMGVVDASRVNALVDLAGKDAALRQGNMKIYQEQAANYGRLQLSADSTNEQLIAQLEEGRKNRLHKIGESLFSEATEFSRNLADQKNNKELLDQFAEVKKQLASSTKETAHVMDMLKEAGLGVDLSGK